MKGFGNIKIKSYICKNKRKTMSVILNTYRNNVDYTWYDSSNILYSECYDKDNDLKDLMIVFKGGRTYLYEKIDVNDYLMFRSDLSQGKALNKYITVKDVTGKPKHNVIRLPDTDLNELENKRLLLIEERNKPLEEDEYKAIYNVQYDDSNKNIKLLFENTVIFEGVENKISLFEILKALNIKASINNVEIPNLENHD